MDVDHFLTSTSPLSAADAVAALLVLDDGRYLVQLRDQKPDIFYPGHWGLFGGAVDPGESPHDALRRELREELGLAARSLQFFTRLDFDLTPIGDKMVYRIIFEVPLLSREVAGLILGEGSAMRAMTAAELLIGQRIVPYDAFVIWLHCHRARFGRPM